MDKTNSMILCGVLSLGVAACSKPLPPLDGGQSESSGSEQDGDTDTGDTGDGTSTDGNLTFVPTKDLPGIKTCDNFAQDCLAGEKCVPYASSGGVWDATKCVPIMGDKVAGDACSYGGIVDATDDCDANTHCWDVMDVDGMSIGVCTPFCAGTPDNPICGPETSCLVANDGAINLCIATCDPLIQDCDSGLACFWANDDFNCVFTTQEIALAEPCGYINDCGGGLVCMDATLHPDCNGSACCSSYCSISEDAACPEAGTECTPFFEEGTAPPEYVDVGVCILPGA